MTDADPIVVPETSIPDAPTTVMHFIDYVKPAADALGVKTVLPLVKSDIMHSNIQIVCGGGETNLHAHTGMDGFWFVLSGRMRFYGKDNKLVAECGPHQGIFVPRNVPYWFEQVGDEPLELLQVESHDRRVSNRRIDYSPPTHVSNVKWIRGSSRPIEV